MSRRTGQTTRIIDKAIQTLFTEGFVKARDHFDSPQANATVYLQILQRLRNEHGLEVRDVEVDGRELTIKLNAKKDE